MCDIKSTSISQTSDRLISVVRILEGSRVTALNAQRGRTVTGTMILSALDELAQLCASEPVWRDGRPEGLQALPHGDVAGSLLMLYLYDDFGKSEAIHPRNFAAACRQAKDELRSALAA
jgi:hypothetical protein